jgi:shikimate 5-dehydrogenase
MLVRQAEAAFEIWIGQPPPVGVMERAARRVLGARPTSQSDLTRR